MLDQTFALFQNGQVVEYPVTLETIQKRGHSVTSYTRVTRRMAMPASDPLFEKLKFKLVQTSLSEASIEYTVEPLSLDVVLFNLNHRQDDEGQLVPFQPSSLSVEQVEKLSKLVTDHGEALVNALAKEKSYDSFDNAISRYSNSTNPSFKADALFLQRALDTTWANLINYMEEIQQGTKTLAWSVSEIDEVIDLPRWSDLPVA